MGKKMSENWLKNGRKMVKNGLKMSGKMRGKWVENGRKCKKIG
jgi:hypothetical protein